MQLSLSAVPTRITHLYASSYLYDRAHPPLPPEPLTWAAIVAEEPFEGEHWEGVYGLPPGFVRKSQDGTKHFYDKDKERERLDWDSRWSTPSLSPLKSDDLDLESDEEDMSVNDLSAEEDAVEAGMNTGLEGRGAEIVPSYTHAHRKDFEALQSRQYWRENRKGEAIAVGRDKFDMGDASTLGRWHLHSHLNQC
jgi:gamma-tubulin complex component 5